MLFKYIFLQSSLFSNWSTSPPSAAGTHSKGKRSLTPGWKASAMLAMHQGWRSRRRCIRRNHSGCNLHPLHICVFTDWRRIYIKTKFTWHRRHRRHKKSSLSSLISPLSPFPSLVLLQLAFWFPLENFSELLLQPEPHPRFHLWEPACLLPVSPLPLLLILLLLLLTWTM